MGSREGRGRPNRDYPSRSDEKSHHGRGNISPSRHLWVGNLSHSLTENELARHFLQFGKLENVAFQPGRSYAFVTYRNDQDAFAAIKVLQGYNVEGNPLRIEFTKAEKSSTAPRDTERRNEPNSFSRGPPPYTPRAPRHSSPDPPFSNKSKMNDKDSEPCEELWIGFPAQLKVDEFILRKTFSPFGEIDKITYFPGRPYAFVRYTNVMAAIRAKQNLDGKLFGNPRVHICFAKHESGPSDRDRPRSPRSPRGSYGRPGSSERFRSDKILMSRDPSVRPPNFIQNFDHDAMSLARNNSFRNDSGPGPGRRYPRDMYEHNDSPSRDNNISAHFREFSPRRLPSYDRPWDLPEDDSLMRGRKKLRTVPIPEDNDLPEYPFSDLERVKHEIPRSGGILGNNFDSRNFGYGPNPGHLAKAKEPPFGERVGDHWNAPPVDNFQSGSFPFPPSDGKRLTPDSRKLPPNEVWKWEGMIVKGGNSICRARCFPVGKPMDMALPEYLDCTAKTSLDMLAKHYFQSSTAWVVFFVPANDPDIPFYNDFMNFLSEKQRAAVIKLDEINTLFLVPPSEFSEKVLKVPGKLSISGVVLRLDSQGSSRDFPLHRNEYKETNQKPINIQSVNTQGHEYTPAQNWAPRDLHNSNSGINNLRSPPFNPNTYSTPNNYAPEFSGVRNGKFPEIPSAPSSNMPAPGLPSEQLAHLASSLLGQQGQFGNLPSTGHQGQYGNPPTTGQQGQHGNLQTAGQQGQYGNLQTTGQQGQYGNLPTTAQQGQFGNLPTGGQYGQFGNLPTSGQQGQFGNLPTTGQQGQFGHFPSEISQFGQVQYPPQNSSVAPQPESAHGNQPLAENVEDPQKRLQATLQLAASLLQQIHQSKGS